MTGTVSEIEPNLIGFLSSEGSLSGTLSVEATKMRYLEVENESGGLTAYIGREG